MSGARGAASWDAEREPVSDDLLTMHWFDGGIASESPQTHRSDCPACEILRLREQLDAARQALEQIANPEYTLSNGVTYVRSREACTNIARAALGVEGETNDD